ncbi:ATP-binding protein [candidate division KSB1 bacterium]
MTAFLVTCTLLLLGTAGYFFYRLKWSRTAFRFQSRLTLLTLLVALIPAILLILFSAYLLNIGMETLDWSETAEDSLNLYINALRESLIVRNTEYLDNLMSDYTLNDLIMWTEESDILYAFRVSVNGGISETDTIFTRNAVAAAKVIVNDEDIDAILNSELENILYQEDAVFESYRLIQDSTILAVGLEVDSLTMSAVSRIEEESIRYGQLRFIEERFSNRNVIYLAGIVVLFFIAVAVIITATWISRGINRPIKDLVSGFEKVGEGDLDANVETKARDEIEFLIKSFNKMTSELKMSQKKLVQTERLAAWRDVARQISHEIKNPLTPIQLSLHRLRKKINIPIENNEVVEESFRTIQEEVDSLRQIATEFSEFARMPKPQLFNSNINEVIKGAALLFEKNEQNIVIKTDLDNTIPEFPLDAEQMKRVFINLIKNSIEATENNGSPVSVQSSIRNELSGDYNNILIDIEDHGCGIDEDNLKKIFDPYFTTKKEGTGLGMPIIKRIVEEHNSEIEVTSQPGQGTIVRIIFRIDTFKKN